MKKIFIIFVTLFLANNLFAEEKVIGAISLSIGKITNQKGQILQAGDKVYFGDEIISDGKSKSQIIFLDETVLTIGESTSITIDEFVFDPNTLNGNFLTTLNKGSVKVLSGLINQKNPENLEVKTAAGTIGSRGTEFQTIVDEEENAQVLLIGPGEDNTLGLRPGAVEVFNELGSVILDTPFSFTELTFNQIPTPPVEITQQQLQQFQDAIDIQANLDAQSFENAIKEGLFDDQQITGNEIIGELITDALNLSDGGLTFDQIADVLGVDITQLVGEDLQAEFENETTENQIAMANAEGGDGLAYILRYGGTNLGDTNYGDFQGITSGTYTYTGNNINMAATKGTGSGTFSGVTTVNFASQTINNTYSGTLTLDGNANVDFSYSFTTDYSNGTATTSMWGTNNGIFSINNSNGTTASTTKSGERGFDPSNFTAAAGNYYADAATDFFNVQMNGSPNPSTGSVATIALNVTDYNDDASDTENTIDGQRTGIMPSRN
ncbi:FecR domain-containing protein [Candidatus Pelagibacter sp. HIMB1782]|uniref:FecR family protein n=1 Tax=Candidatus Pelagibacter sp. HIMB1782 TaxID=3413375 RepID=UPI003F86D668